jgi:hydroxymethylbilane synthase
LTLAAVPPREDVADAWIAPEHRSLASLPAGARVGTSSPRRRAQLLYLRPDLQIVALRGNVETRLNQAIERRIEAVVLAWAGLQRLGLEEWITERLGPPEFLPAVGQGALGIECRRDDESTLKLLAPLDDLATHRSVRAERATLANLEGGCALPMAAWARDGAASDPGQGSETPVLTLTAAVFDPDGRERIGAALEGPVDDPEALGDRVAEALRDRGALRLLRRST